MHTRLFKSIYFAVLFGAWSERQNETAMSRKINVDQCALPAHVIIIIREFVKTKRAKRFKAIG